MSRLLALKLHVHAHFHAYSFQSLFLLQALLGPSLRFYAVDCRPPSHVAKFGKFATAFMLPVPVDQLPQVNTADWCA